MPSAATDVTRPTASTGDADAAPVTASTTTTISTKGTRLSPIAERDSVAMAAVIIVADEIVNLRFKIARRVVVLQQDAVLERLVPALDLALGHRVMRRASKLIHAALREPVGPIATAT